MVKRQLNASFYVDDAFIAGLLHFVDLKATLKEGIAGRLNLLSQAEYSDLRACPLSRLLELAKQRMSGFYDSSINFIVTGRDRDLSGKLECIIKASPDIRPLLPDAASLVQDTDFAHTIAALSYLFEITEDFNTDKKKVVISAMIVHDCAYPKTNSYDDFTSPEVRKRHMDDAVECFRGFARNINAFLQKSEMQKYYDEKDIVQVCAIAAQHDNPSLNKDFDYGELAPEMVFAHREADRLWMLDKAGFALDLLREIIEKGRYDPEGRLKYVIKSHTSEAEQYSKHGAHCRSFNGRKVIYRTEKGFEIFKGLVQQRAEEYGVRYG